MERPHARVVHVFAAARLQLRVHARRPGRGRVVGHEATRLRAPGSRLPLYASGVGKALLAYAPQEFVDEVNASDKLLRAYHRVVSKTDSDETLSKKPLTTKKVKILWDEGRSDPELKDVLSRTLFRVHELKVAR